MLQLSTCFIISTAGISDLRCICFGQENKTIAGFPGAERYDEDRSLLEEDCDILCPCAVPSVITEENAPRIQARIIAEGANGPITYDAHQILLNRNVRSLTAVMVLLFCLLLLSPEDCHFTSDIDVQRVARTCKRPI